MAPRFDDEDHEEAEYETGSGDDVRDLAGFLEENFAGDHRFRSVEFMETGDLLEGESFRLRFIMTARGQLVASAFPDEGIVRVGFATDDSDLNDELETAIMDSSDSLTEFLASAMGESGELEHEVHHFEDDLFYFCSDIHFADERELSSPVFREQLIAYLDGYHSAFVNLLGEDEDEDDDLDDDDDDDEMDEDEDEDYDEDEEDDEEDRGDDDDDDER